MDEKIKACHKDEIWNLMPKFMNIDPITCKWVYKVKHKSDRIIDHYKIRLVIRRFFQKYKEDYEEIFSLVA